VAHVPLRVLLLADTHLGLDMPLRPRVERVRRGSDLFDNVRRSLRPARRGEVDLVVHGGDVLYRSRVRAELVRRAFEPLLEVADAGVPVVVVPGNHERSQIPYSLLTAHQHLHLLHQPATLVFGLRGLRLAVVGFPCERDHVRNRFPDLLAVSGWQQVPADARVLCLHQTVEGARVGPVGYTFRHGPAIIPGAAIPRGFAAVFAGHIHRHQVLHRDLAGYPLNAPVLYPGAIERISHAERDEPKGYIIAELVPGDTPGGCLHDWRFHQLPTRPMIDIKISPGGLSREELQSLLRRELGRVAANALVRILLEDEPGPEAASILSAESLRRLAPAEMIVSTRWTAARR
jgi:DNA repair exonuclease SbcCD nuclease subunit